MSLSGPQRAAVIIAQLDDERAHLLLKAMSENEVVRLMAEVARLPSLTSDDVVAVVSDFTNEAGAYLQVHQGGIELAQRWLQDRLGIGRAAEVMSELEMMASTEPLGFLNRIDPSQIAGFLADEHPQSVALVLAHIYHEHAARVLDRMDEEQAADIVRRMATMGSLPPVMVQRVADELEHRLSNLLRSGSGQSDVGGVSAVAAVLNNVDRGAEKEILARLEITDPELAEVIRSEMFVFDDVVQLDDMTLQAVLRSVVLKDVALSLKTAAPEVAEKFMRNMSERAAEDLQEEVQSLGPQRLSVIEAAQASVVRAVRELADNGTITVGRAN
ncbi:MAG: flagellar motor switch protein FliG, partial [Acidimicrobiales bacterium]